MEMEEMVSFEDSLVLRPQHLALHLAQSGPSISNRRINKQTLDVEI